MISTKQDQRPSWQFYPKDWLTDTGLRMCSWEAKGLWIDLLCYMWFAPIRGSLTYSKTIANDSKIIQQMDSKAIAKLVGENEEKINKLVDELVENQVIEKLENGLQISRKMYYTAQEEIRLSKIRKKAGKKGLEKRWHSKPIAKRGKKPIAKMATSSSTSSSTAKEKEIYKEKETPKPCKRRVVIFQKPSIEDISNYIQEKSYTINPERFFDFYQSKDWFVGKNKMKDWRAAVRNWERMNRERETPEKSEIDDYKEV